MLVWCRIKGWGKQDGEGRLSFLTALRQAGFALFMPVVVLGGIYGGITTPTEASVIAVVYALLVGMFLHREIGLRDLFRILRKSVITSAVIMFIIACPACSPWLLNRQGVPDAAAAWLVATFDSPALYLSWCQPVPVRGRHVRRDLRRHHRAGADPGGGGGALRRRRRAFRHVMVVNLALGMITPPFGVNLFAAAQVAKISYDRIIPPILPFVVVIVICLAIITAVPQLSLFLRDLAYR